MSFQIIILETVTFDTPRKEPPVEVKLAKEGRLVIVTVELTLSQYKPFSPNEILSNWGRSIQ